MLISGVGSSGSVSATSGGKVTAVNNLSTVGAQVIAGNPSRVSITFDNPGSQTVYVYPTTNAVGAAFAPTLNALGGCYPIVSFGSRTLIGECQTAYGAFAAANVNNPLTITESNI